MNWWMAVLFFVPIVLAMVQEPLMIVAVVVLAALIAGGLWLYEKISGDKDW
jgi:uncharacterized membrane protein YhaH (DUF805 family)